MTTNAAPPRLDLNLLVEMLKAQRNAAQDVSAQFAAALKGATRRIGELEAALTAAQKAVAEAAEKKAPAPAKKKAAT